MLSGLYTGLRFLGRVPAFLRRPFSDAEARALVRERLADREAAFLTLARRAIYERRDSPYRVLLKGVGCEIEDLAGLVARRSDSARPQRRRGSTSPGVTSPSSASR